MEQSAFENWKLYLTNTSKLLPPPTTTLIGELSLKSSRPSIHAKVVKVGRESKYTHDGKTGIVQHFLLGDHTGVIQLTLFNELVDEFAKVLQLNSVIQVTDFNLTKRKRKAGENLHMLDIIANQETQITATPGEDVKSEIFPKICKEFYKISPNALIDVVGLVIRVHELRKFESCRYKDIEVADRTGKFTVRLWNAHSDIVIQPFQPIIVKLGRLTKYKGNYYVNADVGDLVSTEENTLTHSLLEWFQSANSVDLAKIL